MEPKLKDATIKIGGLRVIAIENNTQKGIYLVFKNISTSKILIKDG